MSSISPITSNKGQTCPHGYPIGACPICNGSGGGKSSSKTHKYSDPRQTMSLSEMYAIWNRMKAADARKEEAKADILRQAEMLDKTKAVLLRVMHKTGNILNKIENMLPKPITDAFRAITGTILRPLQSLIQKIPEAMKNFNEFIQNVKTQLFTASEKLVSVFGEIKNFIRENVSKNFKKFTKKVYKLLNIFGLEYNKDSEEDEEAIAEISVFKARDIKNLKEIIFRLMIKKNEKGEEDADNTNG